MHILVVEDEKALCDTIVRSLKRLAYSVDACYDGQQAVELLSIERFDLVVLDLNLPGEDGMTVLKTLIKTDRETKVLILSARCEVSDKVAGLDAGANDYLTKPFVLEELLARLVVLTRRKSQFVPNVLTFGNITLDKLNHTISDGNVSISLSMKEYQLMELLMDNTDKIVEKTKIFVRVWGERNDTYYNSAEVYISFLRRKLDALHATFVIKSVRNVGYKLKMLELDEEEH